MVRQISTSLVVVAVSKLFFLYLIGGEEGSAAAILAATIVLWLFEPIPLYITALQIPISAVCFGVLTPGETATVLIQDVMFFLAGVFVLAAAVRKHNLDRRIAYFFLASNAKIHVIESIFVTMTLLTWTFGMFLANTVTCAVVLPISLGISHALVSEMPDELDRSNFVRRLLLICAITPSIGGMATPIGSLPNVVAIHFLEQFGERISFLEWISRAFPLSVLFLGISYITLRKAFPLKQRELVQGREYFQKLHRDLGSIRKEAVWTSVVFLSAILLWILPGFFEQFVTPVAASQRLLRALTPGVSATICGLLLVLVPVGFRGASAFGFRDFADVDWRTLILFAGGLMLGMIILRSGIAANLDRVLAQGVEDGFLVTGYSITSTAILLSEFASNTASAGVLVPTILASATALAQYKNAFVLMTVYGCGFGFMLPISTPPAAMVYSTGKVRKVDMIRVGGVMDLCAAIVIPIYVTLLVTIGW